VVDGEGRADTDQQVLAVGQRERLQRATTVFTMLELMRTDRPVAVSVKVALAALVITVPAGVGAACAAAQKSSNMQEISSLRGRRKSMWGGWMVWFAAGRRFPKGTLSCPLKSGEAFASRARCQAWSYGLIRTPKVTTAD
jgi:hypothetical protein